MTARAAGAACCAALGLWACDTPDVPAYTNPYDAQQPGGPTALDRPSALRLQAATATSATLAWEDRSQAETGYRVERAYDTGPFAPYATLPANTTVFTDTALVGTLPYAYRLRTLGGRAVSPPGDSLRLSWPGFTPVPVSLAIGALVEAPTGFLVVPPSTNYVPVSFHLYSTGEAASTLRDLGVNGRPSVNASGSLVMAVADDALGSRDVLRAAALPGGQLSAQTVRPEGTLFPTYAGFVDDATVLWMESYYTNAGGVVRQTGTWNVRTNTVAASPVAFAGNEYPCLFLPRVQTVFGCRSSGLDDTLAVAYDAATGQRRWPQGGPALLLSGAVSPDQREIGTGHYANGGAFVYDVLTRQTTAFVPNDAFLPTGAGRLPLAYPWKVVAFSHDRSRLLLTIGGPLYVYDRARRRVERVLVFPGRDFYTTSVVDALFAPDGRTLYGAASGTLFRVDLGAAWTPG